MTDIDRDIVNEPTPEELKERTHTYMIGTIDVGDFHRTSQRGLLSANRKWPIFPARVGARWRPVFR